VLQCVAVCCSVLQCGAAYCSVLQCGAAYCSVCCNALQCVAVAGGKRRRRLTVDTTTWRAVEWMSGVAACCSVLQYVAVCCSALHCVTVHCTALERGTAFCTVLWCVAAVTSDPFVVHMEI